MINSRRKIAYNQRVNNPLYHFTWGMRFFFSGLAMLIRNPSLLGLSLIPIVITILLLALLAIGSAWLVGEWISNTVGDELRVLAQVVIFILAVLLGYFLYLPLARVLLAPFSEALSRRAHSINAANTAGLSSRSSFGWGRAMWEGLKLVMFQSTMVLMTIVLSLIFPPIGAPLGIAIAIFLCGLDFIDIPLSARGWSLRRKLGAVWRNRSLAIGFGAAAYLSLLIPPVNLLSLPVGVIGATLLTDAIEMDQRG